ncbi:hypothetical protein TNCV_1293021 [Trichonephila clavipes]|nr:hypothetical protein TNCV_1293021 [Trichonephila clavipes]
MLTGDVECLATNRTSNCVRTIIEDVSGDAQCSVPILLSLLHATEALNQELRSGGTIYFDSRTPLVVIKGTLTAQR